MSDILQLVKDKDPGQREFHQAVMEVMASIKPVMDRNPEYRAAKILERLVEPERVIMFRVPWVDDQGQVQVNRGFRIEMNSAIGPYKGGLRFHPSVNLGILKFLAFEQVFKNALTTLPMGGGKGGSTSTPRARGQRGDALLPELHGRAVPPHRSQHGRARRRHRRGRPGDRLPVRHVQAAAQRVHRRAHGQEPQLGRQPDPSRGHGLRLGLLRGRDAGHPRRDPGRQDLPGVRSGNVAQYTMEKLLDLGGQAGDLFGLVGLHLRRGGHRPREAGLSDEPEERPPGPGQGVCREVPLAVYTPVDPDQAINPLWNHKADCAFPSATQNEINAKDAQNLVDNGVYVVSEGANMPTVPEGIDIFIENKLLYGPGKAANAGGVSVSGLEMTQNSMRLSWTREEVDTRLQMIMKSIHQTCVDAAEQYGTPGNYMNGANIAGFVKVVTR
jgi:glutamate dehydrogenase (NADP+)